MALPQLVSSFTKIMLLPLEKKKPSSLAIWNTNVPHSTQCRASYKVANDSQTILRRSANFQPSIWTNDYIQSLSSEYNEGMYAEQVRVLRENVRMMLCKVEDEIDQLEFIDVLQRLGVAYHFDIEIRNILDNIYNTQETSSKRRKNLYATSLEFRLLRQHGYDISTDVFLYFQDEVGNFKKCQCDDVEGMLSLYEASFHSLEDETILDEARDFTSKFLREYLGQNKGDDHISLLVSHALELPLHWRISRWEAKWFINAYETKQNMSRALLQFAKLDFNIVQSIHQEELKYTSRWWRRTGLGEKLNFARDRLVESFVSTMGTNFKPESEYYRKVMTKIYVFITIIDDVYDVHGTLEELELLTDAIDRWDLNAMDSLPDYMKICFHSLYNSVNEMAYETMKNSGHYITPYLKKAWADLCKSFLIEAKWYHSGYKPSLGEYIENAWISISTPVMLIHAYFLIPHNSFKMEDLVHLEEKYSNIIRSSAMIFRLANDLASYKRENETGDVPKLIQCYMNEVGASEAEACEYVKSMICAMWKKMNKEAHSSSFSQSFIDTVVNHARLALFIYQHGDGLTIQDLEMKNRTISLMFQPIPVIHSQEY